MKVQCKGSGKQIAASLNAKRGTCPSCHRQQDLTGAGKVRRHDRIMNKRAVKKLA
jgi:hypothetical protein